MINSEKNGLPFCRLAAVLVGLAVLTAPSAWAGKKCGDTDECLRAMRDAIAKRGWLGIEYEDHDGKRNPEILMVVPESPAEKGGMRAGDELLSINGVGYDQPREKIYAEVKSALTPGTEVNFKVRRGDETVDLKVVAGEVPEHIAAQWVGRHMLEYHLADEDSSEPSDQEG